MLNTLLSLLFIGGLGAWEIALIMLIVLVFFGAKRIPELARGVGRGIRAKKKKFLQRKKTHKKV